MVPPTTPLKSQRFHPERRKGTWYYGIGLLFSLAAVVVGIIFLLQSTGLNFVGFLILTLAGAGGVPLSGNALLSLFRAHYIVDRNSLQLQWGGRVERIPIREIEWLRTFDSLGLEMHVPRFYRFGIVRGVVSSRELGTIEFMADTVEQSIYIATKTRVYVVSPTDMDGFLTRMRDAMESGSLTETVPLSVVEETVLNSIWQQPVGRLLLVSLLMCNLALLVIVELMTSTQSGVFMFQQQAVISLTSLQLLPYLSIVFGLVDFVLGVIFFQRMKQPEISYVLWASGSLLPVLFSVSIGLTL